MICEYGCGKEAKYQFKNGRWCCSSHYSKCPVCRLNSKIKATGSIGYKHSKETKKKMSESGKGRPSVMKGKTLSYEVRKKMSESSKGKIFSEEHRKKLSISHKGLMVGDKNPFYKKTHTNKTRKKYLNL
jgi:hypothetical protein